ncbi:MAG: hypothetical protein ACLFT8_03975, partial [Desulfovermiculus sp.]
VMERIKLAALTFGDDKLQLPVYNNLAYEVWKSKEAKEPVDENPLLGDPERRAVLMESVAAVSYLMAGSNVLVLRHPESVRLVRSFIQLMVEGGKADQVGEINKLLTEPEIDYLSMSPEMDLSIEEEKKAAAPKKEEKPAAAAKPEAKPEPKAEAKPEQPKAEEKPAAEPKPEAAPVEPAARPAETAAGPAVDEAKIRAEIEAKVRREMEEKVKVEEESKAKAEEEAKAKAEQAKKEAEEKAKREAEEKVKKLEQDAREIRDKVNKAKAGAQEVQGKKAEPVPESVTDRIVTLLDRFHRRAA